MPWGSGRGGRPWRRKRDAVMLRDKFLCQPCKRRGFSRQAHEVDHIVPVSRGGSDDDSNLEAICHECHVDKTAGENPNTFQRKPKEARKQRLPRLRMLKPRLEPGRG